MHVCGEGLGNVREERPSVGCITLPHEFMHHYYNTDKSSMNWWLLIYSSTSNSQIWAIVSSIPCPLYRGHLAMSGDILGGHYLGEGFLLASSRYRPRMLLPISKYQNNLLAQKCIWSHMLMVRRLRNLPVEEPSSNHNKPTEIVS